MGQTTVLTGMILAAVPIGEFDKRVVLLTKERGKISAFAKNARKQNSQLLAAANPFAFGQFEVFEGRSSYSIYKASITNYFKELREDLEGVSYGLYFLEVADYYAQENADELLMLKLLYQTMRALENPSLSNRLVKCAFELKAGVINGFYPHADGIEEPATLYAMQYIISSSIEKLYTFAVSEQVLVTLEGIMKEYREQYLDKEFRSLELLDQLGR